MNRNDFDNLLPNDNKYCLNIKHYLIRRDGKWLKDDEEEVQDDLLPYRELKFPLRTPQISIWEYMSKEQILEMNAIENAVEIRKFIDTNLESTSPRGFPRILFCELMYTVMKFCKSSNFTLEQTSALLSQFYLTHIFFTSTLSSIGAEKLYSYFKQLQFCHSLPFPPDTVKLFNLEETKCIMIFFCRIYLRNLPIIKFLSLPNFALGIQYELEPDFTRKKKKKRKKGKKGKKKGKNKKKKKKT